MNLHLSRVYTSNWEESDSVLWTWLIFDLCLSLFFWKWSFGSEVSFQMSLMPVGEEKEEIVTNLSLYFLFFMLFCSLFYQYWVSGIRRGRIDPDSSEVWPSSQASRWFRFSPFHKHYFDRCSVEIWEWEQHEVRRGLPLVFASSLSASSCL